MITRRSLIAAATARVFAQTTRVAFKVPAHACDCHTHIIGDPRQFPLAADRRYTPSTALPDQLLALHRKLRLERVVMVTPSVYGTDNSATLYGMKTRGPTARGVAVIDNKASDRDLDAMARAGMRGIRLNLASAGVTDPAAGRERFKDATRRMQARGWHIQMFASLAVVAGIRDLVLESPVPVVFDHFGGATADGGIAQPGFAALLELIQSGKAYVKLSGAYRASTQGPAYADVAPLAKALIAANPRRILWGTDWPHPNTSPVDARAVTPFLKIDDGRLLQELAGWATDGATLQQILVENPARLYGY